LLLALASNDESAELLRRIGVTREDIREAAARLAPANGARLIDDPAASREVDDVLAAAEEEVAGFGHDELRPAHVVLGLLKESEGDAAGVLESFGATLDGLRLEALELFAEQDAELFELPRLRA